MTEGGTVEDFLGIQVDPTSDGGFKFTQPGLIEKSLTIVGIQDCNPAVAPTSSPVPLGPDPLGKAIVGCLAQAYMPIGKAECQFGFAKGLGTRDVQVMRYALWERATRNSNKCIVEQFYDIRKAFDSLDQAVLFCEIPRLEPRLDFTVS